MDTFGKRLVELRKKKGLNQSELADLFGKSGKGTISAWETDRTSPNFEELILLADYFSTTTDYLLRGINPAVNEQSGDYITIRKDELIALQRLALNNQRNQNN